MPRSFRSITVVAVDTTPSFNAGPEVFRVGVEPRRVRIDFQHDMAALAESNIAPLPHQLAAVLRGVPRTASPAAPAGRRPGAGKTIMAGLYIKELQIRLMGPSS